MTYRHIAVVGASVAGLAATSALRAANFDGDITVIGDESHVPYDRPPLSKQFLSGEWDADRFHLPGSDDPTVDWKLGSRAVALNAATRRITLENGETIDADGVVLATGARARQLPNTHDVPGVFTLRTLDDARALTAAFATNPERVVVVGAGFVGVEVAATARKRDLAVSVIEPMAAPLARVLGDEIGAVFTDLHRDHGVDMRVGVGVAEIQTDANGHVARVVLTNGDSIDATLVVVGIGAQPNSEWLKDAGLTIENGVCCDATLHAAPDIVAAGDVANWPNALFDGRRMRIEHWDHAFDQGEHAARALLAGDAAQPYAPVPWFWSDQYDRKVQLAGVISPDDAVAIVDGSLADRRFVALYRRDDRLVGVLGMNRPGHVIGLRSHIAARGSYDEALARFTAKP